jgi:hypothetical protein
MVIEPELWTVRSIGLLAYRYAIARLDSPLSRFACLSCRLGIRLRK